jgi:hypothetical protein
MVTCQKNLGSVGINFLLLSAKPETVVPGSGIRYFIFEISSKPDIDKLVNIHVSTYIHICYMLFNQQQCFIYSTATFLSKLRAKKVEKLRNSS